MTFEEKRKKLLSDLDDAYIKIREIVSDPVWTNEMYPEYIRSIDSFNKAIKGLKTLNGAELL